MFIWNTSRFSATREFAMTHQLNGKRVAVLVADGFEQVELTEPRKALNVAGANTVRHPGRFLREDGNR